MSISPSTHKDSPDGVRGDERSSPQPGVLLIFSVGKPQWKALPMSSGLVRLGRTDGKSDTPPDLRMSRQHATISYDGQRFTVVDVGSQNGTFLDGTRVHQSVQTASAGLLRVGESLFLLIPDLRPYIAAPIRTDGEVVLGTVMQEVVGRAHRASAHGSTLFVRGETGTGKELVARSFHAGGRGRRGPFVAVNCATVAQGVAERILFGAKRGAFSGALTDSEGLIQAADGGTLFLDEIAELDATVQAKLLRVIETREVMQLGALRARSVDLQLCCATHKDLRVAVGQGRFREDLYFRIHRPEVTIPPLRRRREEIPWLLCHAMNKEALALPLHTSFVEACLLRHWPGNVREMLGELRAAVQEASGAEASTIEAEHLAPTAGLPFEQPDPDEEESGPRTAEPPLLTDRALPTREQIDRALARSLGNVSAAARLLGLHRTQLRRLMERHGILGKRASD